MSRSVASLLLFGPGALVVLLVVFRALGKVPWFGRLPGDIFTSGKRGTFYFPVATCVLISVAVWPALWLLRSMRP